MKPSEFLPQAEGAPDAQQPDGRRTPDTPVDLTPNGRADEHLCGSTRRQFFERAGLLTLALALGGGKARAGGPAYYKATAGEMAAETGVPQTSEALNTPEALDEKEIVLMDETMQALFRHYLQLSFWLTALPLDKQEASKQITDLPSDRQKVAKQIIETAIRHYNQLLYRGQPNGTITLTKRHTRANPNGSTDVPDNFKLVIRNGVITEMNGVTIEKGKTAEVKIETNLDGLEKWEDDAKELQRKIEQVALKMTNLENMEEDNQWYEYYELRLPFMLRDLLLCKKAAFRLNNQEAQILNKLEDLLKAHPKSNKEIDIGGKEPTISVTRISEGPKNERTPSGMAELNDETTGNTFGGFTFDGHLMANVSTSAIPQWKRASTSSFADLHRAK